MRNLFYLVLIGLVVYTIITLVQRAGAGPDDPTRGGGRRPSRRPGPTAPDDDPAFLWQLELQRRRAEHDSKDAGGEDGSDQDQPGPRGTTDHLPE